MHAADTSVLTGRLLSFRDRPADIMAEASYDYWSNGALAMHKGIIVWRGDRGRLPDMYKDWPRQDHGEDLILPGLIDTHTHFPQMQIIAAYSSHLLEWLETHTYPAEAEFADIRHARTIADAFLSELIAQGVTTAAVYGTSHPVSVEAFFAAAQARDMRMIAGKVMMDRAAPAEMCDTPRRAYEESSALIAAWHKKARLLYAITPRFAITSTPEQLDVAKTLKSENPDCYLQTHLSETIAEIHQTMALYPSARDYTDVYEQYDLLGERTLFGHCLHLTPRERDALKQSRSVAVFCPSSNLFLGSGLFDYAQFMHEGVRVALASDVGAGTDYGMLATAADAYKVCQLKGYSFNPLESFYTLTLGNARALGLEDKIGTLEVGTEADIIVLNSAATAKLKIRMQRADSLADELFVLQTLGDERCIRQTYLAGKAAKPAQ